MATFNTEKLKGIVALAIQGAGFNKLLELSGYIGIKVQNGVLYLNTTDGTNYMRVSDSCSADDFDVTVDAELFSKLIGKFNSDTVDMDIVDDNLVIKGNGKYTLGVKPNETGSALRFPDKFPNVPAEVIGTITFQDLVTISTAIKASLSSVAGSLYADYYVGDVVASTDKVMISRYAKKLLDANYMLNRQFVDLMCLGNSDVTVSKADNMLIADISLSEDSSIQICTPILDTVSEFNIDGINKFADLDVKSFCRFKKVQMLDLLDRLALFVNKFDDGAVTLHFTEDYIEVSSLANSGIERVEITEFKNAEDISIKINIERLRNQLKAYGADIVDMYYGSDVCIKLVDGDISQVIALIK